MAARLLITGAGTGPGNNLIRSLRTGDPSLFIVGCNADRFFLKNSSAERNYLIPPLTYRALPDVLGRIIEAERVDLVIPTTDQDIRFLSGLRDEFPGRLFLPGKTVIDLCQDKHDLTAFLRARGVPAPVTFPVPAADGIEEVFGRFAPRSRLWCRMRAGSGSIGAIPVKSPEQARGWIRCWEAIRGVPAASFILSEYLPGRDFSCQSLWLDGKLVLVKTCERLSYLGPGNQPSVVSSLGALTKTVFEPEVAEIGAAAVRSLDERVSGAFSVDLKEDADGVPAVTEINAGRLSSGTNIFDLTGKHNMAITYVRLALGEPVDISEEYDAAEGFYMLRDLDAVPAIVHAEELFTGIREVESEGSGGRFPQRMIRKEETRWATSHRRRAR
ncbi:MAG: hypothetical protein HYY64_00615 [Candidatus Rokubacteria bacterium]|nr:hypothetical protein [Candidatus Rokubacteria bacterium]